MPTGGCRSQIAIEKKNGPTAVDKPRGMYNNTPLVIYPLEGNPIDKSRRQAALLRLIRSRPVENQEQIVALMLREGFPVTQASVSRDIREMGLVKLAGRYLSAERALAARPEGERLELEVGLITGLEPVGANLVVVKTRGARRAPWRWCWTTSWARSRPGQSPGTTPYLWLFAAARIRGAWWHG